MQVQSVDIEILIPDPENVRLHNKKNLDAIKNSLIRFGQQKPVVVDKDNKVVAGNGTLAAAKDLGWDQLEVVYTDLNDSESVAFAIADNRTAELAEWDRGTLAKMFKDKDVGEVGFSRREIEQMVARMEEVTAPAPERQITAELFERHDYLVVVFENQMDWNVATQKLGIGTVKMKMNGKQTIHKYGLGRVISAERLLDCLK